MNIRLNAKLSAYSKGIIPDSSHILYAEEGSGLKIETDIDKKRKISIKQEILTKLPDEVNSNTTYYINNQYPEIIIGGGTAYSDGNNEYIEKSQYTTIFKGGKDYTIKLLPIDSKGVYNGN